MSQYVPDAAGAVEIDRYEQLVEYFSAAAKPRSQWCIGTEYEKVAVRLADGHAVPFSGPNGIEALLERLSDRYAWEPIREEGRIIALAGGKAAITLEPGGQLELSGEKCESIHCARAEFSRHIEEIVTVGDELGIAFLGLGMQPVSRIDEIEQVPKKRYGIMGPYMQKVGTLGQRMMKQTATVQVNVDYADEADAVMKLRVGMGLSPLLNAMFANSPLSDGGLNKFLSYRGHIWTDTDPDRCGLLRFVFEPGAGFERYVEYALDVPMYFIIRDGQWFNMTEHTFRDFFENGYNGYRATVDDWNNHLTTLFPEARMKRYIELRSADSQAPELMLAVPAIAKGVLYEPDCLLAAWDLVKGWSWEQRLETYHAAHRVALRAKVGRIELRELARELVEIATEGLDRQRTLNDQGEDESVYLERLEDQVKRGVCPAEEIVQKWDGEWSQEIARLIEGSSYRTAA